eukprot:gnl/TRDRNA2_/TRDRNA2_131336_c1_seq1.p1 gnl/TRDRNA2_/TRDRNA2_131336_c1~~gnl/TRDRNA2_/TRDRNA2_131336_c1_seq1.p1  ORF type:complete len:578 (-),score=107.21 gnl/TRDRNA2_/TRDRNA2_131336_c1_seq1:103-1836(-)
MGGDSHAPGGAGHAVYHSKTVQTTHEAPPTVQLLERRLQSADDHIRHGAVESLPMLNCPVQPLLSVTKSLMEHENYFVRRSCNDVMTWVGNKEVVKLMGPGLDSEEGEVRRNAAKVLLAIVQKNRIPDFDIEPESPKRAGSKDSNPGGLKRRPSKTMTRRPSKEMLAAEAEEHKAAEEAEKARLAKIAEERAKKAALVDGDSARAAAKEFAKRLKKPDPRLVQMCIENLMEMGHYAQPFAVQLGSLMGDQDANVNRTLFECFQKLGWMMQDAAPNCGKCLAHKDKAMRYRAHKALMLLVAVGGRTARKAADATAGLLENSDPGVRRQALGTLIAMGSLAAPHSDKIASLLEDEDLFVRNTAVRTLRAAGPGVEQSLKDIVKKLEHEEAEVRRAGVDAIKALAPINARFADAGAHLLEEDVDETHPFALERRVQALEILGGAGKNANRHLFLLVEELAHEDWSVRRGAVEAFGDLGAFASRAANQIARRLLHHTAYVRIAAAEALGRMGDHAGQFGQRVELLLQTEDDPDVKAVCQRIADQHQKHADEMAENEPSSPVSPTTGKPKGKASPTNRGSNK